MKIFVVDSAAKELMGEVRLVKGIVPDCELKSFQSSLEALGAARETEVDVALVSTKMPELEGLDLGLYLKEMYPFVNIIYLSDSRKLCYEALEQHASGYLLKPADAEGLRREFGDLRHALGKGRQRRVFAQTFGNFELFVDGAPVDFKYTRTKELLALLINNRGAQTTNGEIIGTLWEDDGDPEKKSSYLSNLRQDLQNTLNRLKATDVINKQRGSMGIAVDRVECDLYDWLAKKKDSKYHYLGDYMNQYSWAETMHAELDELSYALEDEY